MAQGQLCDVSTAECMHASRGNHSSRGPAMPGSALELSPPSTLASGGALFATPPPPPARTPFNTFINHTSLPGDGI